MAAAPGLRLDGVLSHLAEAEVVESELTARQQEHFDEALAIFATAARRADEERAEPLRHLANSAAALHRPATRHSLVRAGLALYGIDPAGREAGLVGVMSVKARLVQVREIEAGERVGYGGSWTAPRRSRIGVAPLGYADGYPWRLANRARAFVAGDFVPVVGAISMDMVTLDLTASAAETGSVVTLLAGDAKSGPTAVELADQAGTISYEILCHFGLRLPKRYLDSR
jgi:alanine racemase